MLSRRTYWIIFLIGCVVMFIAGLIGRPSTVFCIVGAWLLLGLGYFLTSRSLIEANAAYRHRDYEKALHICDRILSKNPCDVNALLTASAVYTAQCQLQKAREFCDRVIALSPRNVTAWNNRAAVHFELADAEAAISDATCAITLNKRYAQAYRNRVAAFIVAYQYEKALKDLESLTAMGRSPHLKLVRASVDVAMNKLDDAFGACNKAIDRGEQPLPMWFVLRGGIYSKRGASDKAISDFASALKLDPSCQIAIINRIPSLCMVKQYDQARSDITSLLQQPLSNYLKSFVLSNRARVNLAQGKLDDAINDATNASSIFPKGASILSTRGLVLARLHRNEEALADLNRAIELDHFDAEAHWFRAELYEAMGDTTGALADKKIAEEYQYKPYL